MSVACQVRPEVTVTVRNPSDRKFPRLVSDILVVAPYNVQVAALASKLPLSAGVGTVDKFQGQEARA
jgi:superfamily I DNA and/or RNA helicase